MSNPEAPAGMSAPASRSDKLSQDDFRRLMSTPRNEGGVLRTAGAAMAPPAAGNAAPKKKWYKPPATKDPSLPPPEPKPQYRDRARERREGMEDEYSESYRILQTVTKSSEAENTKDLDYEQSKFLGGDAAHTHLVRGLDFALVNRLREEAERERRAKEEAAAAARDAQIADTQAESMSEETARIVALARVSMPLPPPPPHKERAALFNPGRMHYSFRVSESDGPDLPPPTTVIRSKLETQAKQAHVVDSVNDLIIQKVCTVIAELRTSEGRRRIVTHIAEPVVAATPPTAQRPAQIFRPAAADDDEDIFPDIGKYQPSESDKQKDARPLASTSSSGPGRWFAGIESTREESVQLPANLQMAGASVEVGPVPEAPADTAASKVSAIVASAMESLGTDQKEAVKAHMQGANIKKRPTAYEFDTEEAPPPSVSYANFIVEEDDEDIFAPGGPAADEEFDPFKEGREMARQALAEYGTYDEKKKAKNEKQKLNQSMQKIGTIIKEKFNRPDLVPKTDAELKAERSASTNETTSETQVDERPVQKKRRL